jgi:hypothetical protein
MKIKTWRCFHCNEVFRSESKAREHFGPTECAPTSCQVSPEQLRDLEKQLSAYRNEDTDLHRQIARLESELFTATRKAEEEGYARGLRDSRASEQKYEITTTATV